MLEALNTDDKDLFFQNNYSLVKCLESFKKITDAEFCVIFSKENENVQKFWLRHIYVPSSTSTMEEFVALKHASAFLSNCESGKIM